MAVWATSLNHAVCLVVSIYIYICYIYVYTHVYTYNIIIYVYMYGPPPHDLPFSFPQQMMALGCIGAGQQMLGRMGRRGCSYVYEYIYIYIHGTALA